MTTHSSKRRLSTRMIRLAGIMVLFATFSAAAIGEVSGTGAPATLQLPDPLPPLDFPVPVESEQNSDSEAAQRFDIPGPAGSGSTTGDLDSAQRRLELAKYLRNSRKTSEAEALLTALMEDRSPDPIKRQALLELAAAAQDRNEPSRAVQIYAQFLDQWSDDLRAPEILLRQGQIFRQMGMYNLALTKFYAVMTRALVLKNDQLAYYERLVARAQTEIAETHFHLGKFADAAEFYTRLLKQNNSEIERPQLLYKLVRCNSAVQRYHDAVGFAHDYLARYPEGSEQPEIRFHLALALKELGHNQESLQQVLTLLREQRERTRENPAVWRHWQQRTGNLIANQLYREGDYTGALAIYLDLSQVDDSHEWQLPLWYQIGITYEQLLQPQKAGDTYKNILARETAAGANPSPGLKAVFEMTRWRMNFIGWQDRADAANRQITSPQP